MSSYHNRDPQVKDKTALSLTCEYPYLERRSLYWSRAQYAWYWNTEKRKWPPSLCAFQDGPLVIRNKHNMDHTIENKTPFYFNQNVSKHNGFLLAISMYSDHSINLWVIQFWQVCCDLCGYCSDYTERQWQLKYITHRARSIKILFFR